MMKWIVQLVVFASIIVFGYKYRYKLMNTALALGDLRQLIISQTTQFPDESACIYQRP